MISGIFSLTRRAAFVAVILVQPVSAALINHTVDGFDNLYNTGWAGNPHPEAIGTGLDARVVQEPAGTAFDFGGGLLRLSATGLVTDDGISQTDADGLPNNFQDGFWRGLPVYSLIGIWSASSSVIDPIGDAFAIGTSLEFQAPVVTGAYLFLAENDGLFNDNAGAYEVVIDFSVTEIPLPAAFWLFLSGFAGLGLRVRRQR